MLGVVPNVTGVESLKIAMLFLKFDAVNCGWTKILATWYSCGVNG